MADGLASEMDNSEASASFEALFHRRIDFHPSRNNYSALSTASADFHLQTLNPSSDTGEIHDHGLDPELNFRTTFRRIGAGLENLGNTCFLNSVLQCLTYTEPLASYLESGKHKSSCHTAGFCALCALQNHVMTALQSTGKILSPKHLVQNLQCISRNFHIARQEDAHEYMINLLESMHKCCLPSGVPSESPSAYDKSLVHRIFGGHLRSQIKCTNCGYCSNKTDPFLDLSLEIQKAYSLLKALEHFTAAEELDGGQRNYQCDFCKEKVRALKQLTIHKAPFVLTIHLKRFDYHINGQKIDRKVEFEPTLDLKPFFSGPNVGDLKYTLYGVLVHAGWSTHSGHYYCFVRTSTGLWHALDDNQVTQVSETAVLAQEAYMLFYVRSRTTSVKGSVDGVKIGNECGNAPDTKSIPLPISDLNKIAENIMMEGKLRDTDSIFPKAKASSRSYRQYNSGQLTSSNDFLSNRTFIENSDSLPSGLQEALSKGSVIPLHKNIQLAEKDASLLVNMNRTCNFDPVNAAPLMLIYDQSDAKTCQSHNFCCGKTTIDTTIVQSICDFSYMKVKSDSALAQSSSLPDPLLTCPNENDKLMEMQIGAGTLTNAQSYIACGRQAKSLLAERELVMHLSELDVWTVVQNEAIDTINMQQGTAGYNNKCCSSSMHPCVTNLHNHEEREIKLTEQRKTCSANKRQADLEQVVAPFLKEPKQKKLKNMFKGFGRSKFFLASISRHKFKKSRIK